MGDKEEAGDDCHESGPFCRHYGDPADCEEVCVCGHRCHEHDRHDGECRADGCGCTEWREVESC